MTVPLPFPFALSAARAKFCFTMKRVPKLSRCYSLLVFTAILLAALSVGADEVNLKLMSSGAMPKLGGYIPQRLTLSSEKPAELKQAPAGLTAPLYGALKLGPANAPTTYFIVLDEPVDKPARMFVDTTGTGEVSADSAADWTARTNTSPDGTKLVSYSGGATFKVGSGPDLVQLHIPMYRFDKNDPARAQLKDNLFYYSDYARAGALNLGGKTYQAMLIDDSASGDFSGQAASLLIDINGDGKFDRRREGFKVSQPFNIAGTTYEIRSLTASGVSFQIAKSDKTVPETKPPINLASGQKALSFEAKTTDGVAVKFPDNYKGKLVMLDFWATWCGPCRAELPNLTNAYSKLHDQGFEVLGISLDQKDSSAKLTAFTKENHMPWPQVYDGKYWQAEVARLYDVDSIPRAFLVDGDTGIIVVAGDQLRGESLSDKIEQALAKKKNAK
jgi:peroxiredoxin